MVIIELTKTCQVCGKTKPVFPGDDCPECLKYFADQWRVTWGIEKEQDSVITANRESLNES